MRGLAVDTLVDFLCLWVGYSSGIGGLGFMFGYMAASAGSTML